ncbi:MAG: endolytic transglycosylase MltG [Solirubrobacteraceae bacterium]|nr:endolytic transglycosylase MltG [Solirubrobacteraceae bacterium]
MSPGRTPQEREAARIERERRRAERLGKPLTAASVEAEEVLAPESVSGRHETPGAETADVTDAEPAFGPPFEVEPAFELTPRTEVERTELEPRTEPPAADQPLGTVRRHRHRPQPGASGLPHRPLIVHRRRRAPGGVIALVTIGATLAAALAFALLSTFTPFKGEGSGKVAVQVPKGASTKEIGDLLARRGVVGSGLFFAIRASIGGDGDGLRAGRHTLRRDMGNGEAIAALSAAPKAAATIRVTIPEGPSRRESAALVRKAGVVGDYVAASKRSAALDPRRYGAPRDASLEGFLFPATYELRTPARADALVREQLRAFRRSFGQVSLGAARSRNLTAYDVLIIASMIERETARPAERRLVASVIYNRLRAGMPLGIDATIRYAEGNWTRPLRQSELRRHGPYNTRLNRGLPPTPIGNPGLASIEAAARPARSSYLYYVVKPCGNGAHSFSSSDVEFQRDVDAYNAKRAQLGGRDPSVCPK